MKPNVPLVTNVSANRSLFSAYALRIFPRSTPRTTRRGSAAARATTARARGSFAAKMRIVAGGERYAVVSCHAERPLDDRVWAAFERLLRRRPGGFVVTPFLRPPDAAAGEDEER